MSKPDEAKQWYWTRYLDDEGNWNRRTPHGPPGAELAALRRGLGRPPGDVPAMWPFYTKTNPEGRLTREYAAEHAALCLYGLHQQSQAMPMHRQGVGLGTALLKLRLRVPDQRGTATQGNKIDWSRIDPIDRRFTAAATATDFTELVLHLRGLITQLRGIPIDYTQLYYDLCDWHVPGLASAVRRRWGMQYFTREKPASDDQNAQAIEKETVQ